MKDEPKYSVSMSFAEVMLPPFKDILVLGSKCPQGKIGVSKCLNFLAPDNFELIETEDLLAEAILVNKKILKRMSSEKIIGILKERVFPYITNGEIIRVDFKVTLSYDNIEIDINAEQKHACEDLDSKNV